MAAKYIIRKYNGDDEYSWAVFVRFDLRGLGRGPIFVGDAQPVICGCSRSEANRHRKRLEAKHQANLD